MPLMKWVWQPWGRVLAEAWGREVVVGGRGGQRLGVWRPRGVGGRGGTRHFSLQFLTLLPGGMWEGLLSWKGVWQGDKQRNKQAMQSAPP